MSHQTITLVLKIENKIEKENKIESNSLISNTKIYKIDDSVQSSLLSSLMLTQYKVLLLNPL